MTSVDIQWTVPVDASRFPPGSDAVQAARADLLRRLGGVDVESSPYWFDCNPMHGVAVGSSPWTVVGCCDTLPNTHWHVMRHAGGVWVAWRLPKHSVEAGPKIRYSTMRDSIKRSPFGDSFEDLFNEVTRHGYGLGVPGGLRGDGGPEVPNTYPYGEVYALSLMLGLDVAEAEPLRMLYGLGGLADARRLADSRGGLDPFYCSNRLPVRA